MAQLSHTIEKVLLCDPERNTSMVHVHVPECSPVEFRTLGQLFFLVEIDRQLPINQELISVIEDEMQKAYYQTAQMRVEAAFEQALQHVNEQLYQLVEGGVTEWLEHFHIIVGVVKDEQLIFTHLGNINASLIHRGRVTDIIASAGREREKMNPLKIFSTVVGGTITDGDHILLYTPSVLDYLSQEKLRRIVLERVPDEAVRQLEILLDEASHHAAFGILLLQAVRQRETIHLQTNRTASPRPVTHTQSSMEHMIARERSTDRLLAPSFWLTIRQLSSAITERLGSFFRGLRNTQKTTRRPSYLAAQSESPAADYAMPKPNTRSAKKSLRTLASFSSRSGKAVGHTLQNTLAKRQQWFEKLKQVPGSVGRLFNRLVKNFLAWNFTQKAIFIAIILVLFFFAQSIVSIGRRGATEEAQRQETEAVAAIEDKIFQAEASLSYEDEVRANTLLDEAETFINGLENQDTDSVRAVREEIKILREQANKVLRIDTPEQLVDLSTQENFTGTAHLVQLGDKLYLPDENGSTLWSVSLAGEALALPTGIEEAGVPVASTRQGSQTALVYHENGAVYSINTAGTIQTLTFTPPGEQRNIIAMATYQSRVYFLDTLNNQVFRSLQGTGAIGTASAWMQAEYDLSSAISIAIDGSIYLAETDGDIRVFSQGTEDEFSLREITPALESIDQIWTDADTANLYLLDRSDKRLLVFTKNGRLLQQYTSEAWGDLKAMSVDEAGGVAYLLNGSSVYRLNLE